MKKILSVKTWLFATLFFISFAIPAWSQTGFEEDVEDVSAEAEAPINQFVIAGLIAGSILAYKVLGKEEKAI